MSDTRDTVRCSCAPTLAAPSNGEWATTVEQADEETEQQAAGRAELASKWGALLDAEGRAASGAPAAASSAAAAASPIAALPAMPAPSRSFEWDRHVAFFSMHLKSIPAGYESLDTSRMTLLYFCLAALDVLGALETTSVQHTLRERVGIRKLSPMLMLWV